MIRSNRQTNSEETAGMLQMLHVSSMPGPPSTAQMSDMNELPLPSTAHMSDIQMNHPHHQHSMQVRQLQRE